MPFYLRRTRLPGNPADDYEVFDAKQVTKRLNVKHRCRQRAQDANRRRHMLDLAKDLRQCNGRQTQPTNWHALTSRNFSKSLGWSVEHGRAANKHDTAKIRFRSIS